jgi:hypothetical protein
MNDNGNDNHRGRRIGTFLVVVTIAILIAISSFDSIKIAIQQEKIEEEQRQPQKIVMSSQTNSSAMTSNTTTYKTTNAVPEDAERTRNTTSSSSSYLAFNDTNPHTKTFCPYATCHNSPICGPCNQRFIFIAATGRSASTTLLRTMNALPKVRLAGENYGELNVVSSVESNLLNRNNVKILDGKGRYSGAWKHNDIPEQAMACPIQHIFKTINPPDMQTMLHVNQSMTHDNDGHDGAPNSLFDPSMILGHKTIRMFKPKVSIKLSPKEMSEFLKRNFPCSKVIINIRRNITNEIHSREHVNWSKDGIEAQGIQKVSQLHEEFAEWLGPEMGKLIYMEDWTNNVTIVNQVVEWLGFQDCVFHDIFHENHHGYGRDKKTHPHLGPNCRAP